METPRIEARRKSSSSFTQRSPASICPKVDLLKSSPDTWQRAANCSCVIFSSFRKCRIWGPTTFAGLFAFLAIITKFGLDPKPEPTSYCYESVTVRFWYAGLPPACRAVCDLNNYLNMNWNPISALVGRKGEGPDQSTKQQEFSKLIQSYDFRVTAPSGAMVPPDLSERLANVVAALPQFAKRDVILTGLVMILEICERSPGQAVPELKLGGFKSRGQSSLGFRAPLELDRRLTNLISSLSGVSKRDVIVAGLDLILTKCEAINGGPFISAQDQMGPREQRK